MLALHSAPCPARSLRGALGHWVHPSAPFLPSSSSRRRRLASTRAFDGAAAGGSDGAAGGDPAPPMSTGAALATLGLAPDASFDEILAARNSLQSRNPHCGAVYEQAYEHLLHRRLRQRLSGELDIPLQVRYADAMPRRPPWTMSQARSASAPSPLARSTTTTTSSQQQLSSDGADSSRGNGGSPVLTLAPPKQQLATQQVAVYTALGVWALVQAVAEPPQAQLMDFGGAQLSLAMVFSMFTLKEHKQMTLSRAVSLTLAAMLLGTFVGSAVEGWVRVDIFPIGAFQSPGVLCSEFSIAGLLFCSLFLV